MPYPASLIAHAFVKRGIQEGRPVTQMKLQKMVYFAHGYHLAKYNEPLVEEEFEAWKFGPVLQAIYGTYKSFGSSPIKEPVSKYDKELEQLSDSAKDAIDYTWKVTKDLSALVLSNWTHRKDSPWGKAYIPNSFGVPIDNTEIKNYFTELLSKNGNHTRSHQTA